MLCILCVHEYTNEINNKHNFPIHMMMKYRTKPKHHSSFLLFVLISSKPYFYCSSLIHEEKPSVTHTHPYKRAHTNIIIHKKRGWYAYLFI